MPNTLHEAIPMPFEDRTRFYEAFYTVAYGAWGGSPSQAAKDTRGLVVKAIHTQQVERYLKGEQ